MIINLDESPDNTCPPYDVCIIGSGPAGIVIANELHSDLRICVLESGLKEKTPFADELRKTISKGRCQIKLESRERMLGGASNTWSGLSRQLDPIDLKKRSWVPHSGWPIEYEELASYYELAALRYAFPSIEDLSRNVLPDRGEPVFRPSWRDIEEKIFLAANQPQRFGKEFAHIFNGPRTDLYLDATALKFCQDEQGAVTGVLVRSHNWRDAVIEANIFVIAAGGIDNARLLLNSTDISKAGLGNSLDQVGRYFMNHPKEMVDPDEYLGEIEFKNPVRGLAEYGGYMSRGYSGFVGLRLTTEEQEKSRSLGSYVRLIPLYPFSDDKGVASLVYLVKRSRRLFNFWRARQRDKVVALLDYSETGDESNEEGLNKWLALKNVIRNFPRVLQYLFARLSPKWMGSLARPLIRRCAIRSFVEMGPHPDNRVELSSELDALGQRLPQVVCAPKDLDVRSLKHLHSILAAEIDELGIGKMVSRLESRMDFPITFDSSHYMGTTRMGVDPKTSVVNSDSRLHEFENVYIAGSSVFPTGGCANPTMTIVAMTIRLANHLKDRFQIKEAMENPVVGDEVDQNRIVVVGSGRRVTNAVLPALEALNHLYSITGIWGKSRKLLPTPNQVFRVEDFPSITALDIKNADVFYLAVPPPTVESVIISLTAHDCSHITLITETPSVHLGSRQQLYSRFKQVHVAEDMVFLPWIDTIEKAINGSNLGPITFINAQHSLYRYHGVAFVRRLCHESLLNNRIWAKRSGTSVHYRFGRSVRVEVEEPRNYQSGRLYIQGKYGRISDRMENDYTPISLVCKGDRCTGFRIGSVSTQISEVESALLGTVNKDDTVITKMHDLKRVGLYRLLTAVAEGKQTWTLEDGLIDTQLDERLRRTIMSFGRSPRIIDRGRSN